MTVWERSVPGVRTAEKNEMKRARAAMLGIVKQPGRSPREDNSEWTSLQQVL